MIRTTDIDFLVPKKPPRGVKIDISKVMADEGFIEEFSHDGWVTYHKPEFHVEFLMSRVGPRPGDARQIPQLGITARPLRHMWLLTQNVIQVTYAGIPIQVPHPAAYGLHKLIIAARRKNQDKQAKDREQARTVLTVLSKQDQGRLNEIYQRLSAKERKVVRAEFEQDPLLMGLIGCVRNLH